MENLEFKIIEIIAEYLGKDPSAFTPDQTFTQMGLDSLDIAELVISLEDNGVTVDDISPQYNTPKKLADHINKLS